MTTIAYRDGIMAADTLMTGGDIRRGRATKIRRTPKGELIGCTGRADICQLFMDWADAGFPTDAKPTLPNSADMHAIVVFPDGSMASYAETLLPTHFRSEYCTQGSGNEIALGALAMGASAVEAVECAIRFDIASGGEIETVSLEEPAPFDNSSRIATMRAGAPVKAGEN